MSPVLTALIVGFLVGLAFGIALVRPGDAKRARARHASWSAWHPVPPPPRRSQRAP